MRTPQPETKKAILPSAGFNFMRATAHTFSHVVKEPDPEFGLLRPQFRFYYTCDITGAVRPWGLEGQNTEIAARSPS